MKISSVRRAYMSELTSLYAEQRKLADQLRREESLGMDGGHYDKVELRNELAHIEKEYERVKRASECQFQRETLQDELETAKEQGEAMEESMQEMLKCIETARRIAEGSKVPAEDEKKLMEFDHELYMAAKNLAFLRRCEKQKEYDSLWEDENKAGQKRAEDGGIVSPQETGTDVSADAKEAVAPLAEDGSNAEA